MTEGAPPPSKLARISIRAGFVISCTVLAACSLLTDTRGFDVGAPDAATVEVPTVEAGPEAAPPSVDAAAADVDAATTCTDHVAGTSLPALLPLDAAWALRGVARVVDDGVRLTNGQAFEVGAMWRTEDLDLDRFDVSIRLRPTPIGNEAADGSAFAWVRGPAPGEPKGTGNTLGLLELQGYAVVVDILGSRLRIRDLSKSETTWEIDAREIPPVADGREHALRVRNDRGIVTVWLDGARVLDPLPIPSYLPVRGGYGVTASTGAGVSRNDVLRVAFRTELCP